MKLTIRRTRLSDLQKLLDLFQAFRPIDSPPKKATKRVKTYFKKIIRDKNNIILVAESKDEIIGSMQLTVINAIIVGIRPWATLSNIIVKPNYQRHGVGAKLLTTLEREARKNNCYRISVTSKLIWKIGHRFYQKYGYKLAGKDFRKYFK